MPDDLYTTDELLKERIAYRWVLDNLLPVGAKLLFHGREGLGKSVTALGLALAVLEESHLFGTWQAHPRRSVLYIQADLPKILHRDRIDRLCKLWPWVRGLPLYHYCPPFFDVMRLDDDDALTGQLRDTNPCLVIWDVLRAVEHLREEEHVPGIVYGQMQHLFPESAHVIVHHDKKVTEASAQGLLDPREAFSGMKGWINLVISAWHLEENGKYLRLSTTKNNCGIKPQPIVLQQDEKTLLPFCKQNILGEAITRWRMLHRCNPRKLTPGERERLKRYLHAGMIASTGTVERLVEGL
jgi:hypothetical protein